jgi:arsenate reductase-like glutaredoxin family protein
MESRGIAAGTVVNASKEKIGAEPALELVREHTKLVAAKGKKVVEIDLKTESPADDEIVKLVMGPSGNLRAPTWTRGKTIVVGFNEEAYAAILD